MSKKKYYSAEFKKEAVRLAEDCGNKSQRGRPAVARDLGIHATVIGKWQKQMQTEADAARGRKHFQGLASRGMKKWTN